MHDCRSVPERFCSVIFNIAVDGRCCFVPLMPTSTPVRQSAPQRNIGPLCIMPIQSENTRYMMLTTRGRSAASPFHPHARTTPSHATWCRRPPGGSKNPIYDQLPIITIAIPGQDPPRRPSRKCPERTPLKIGHFHRSAVLCFGCGGRVPHLPSSGAGIAIVAENPKFE